MGLEAVTLAGRPGRHVGLGLCGPAGAPMILTSCYGWQFGARHSNMELESEAERHRERETQGNSRQSNRHQDRAGQ